MKKRLLCILLSLCMVLTLMPAVAWADTPTTTAAEYAAADPAAAADTDYALNTTDKILTISTAKGAAWWSANGASYSNYTVKLAANINVSNFLWKPVSGFSGTFDGQSHTITGLTVNENSYYAGLFGLSIDEAIIKNVGLIDSSISASGPGPAIVFAGGIVACAMGGRIINCYNTGSITAVNSNGGTVQAGGIAGRTLSITNCYNTGTVTATADQIAAENAASTVAFAGGIVGTLDRITNCYNIGTVTANANFGIAKADGITPVVGANITDCYYRIGCVSGSEVNAGTSLTDAQMKAAAGEPDALIDKLNDWVSHAGSGTNYSSWKADSGSTNSGYPVFEAPTPTAAEYAAADPAAAANTDYALNTTDKVLTINTAKGAAWWSANGALYLDYTVKLANNIDMSAFLWSPVGTYDNAFTGTFDGQEHSISGMNAIVTSTDDEVYAGLLGAVVNGTVKNVTVSGKVNAVSADAVYAGGITGIIMGSGSTQLSYLENCVSNVTVTAQSNDTNSSDKFAFAGGLAGGHCYTHTINCVNTGSVAAYSEADEGVACAGGLSGMVTTEFGSCVNNSYNTGEVSAAVTKADGRAYAGGITGLLQDEYLRNCYNTGSVIATCAGDESAGIAGGIAGYVSNGTVSSCYYLDSSADIGVKYKEHSPDVTATSKTAVEMKLSDFVDDLNSWVDDVSGTEDFQNAKYWSIFSGTNSGYPAFSGVSAVYTITFDANGGSVSLSSAEVNGEGKLTTLPTPTRSSYTFDGWFTADNGGGAVTTATVFNRDTTIYAQWTYTGGSSNHGGGGTAAPDSGTAVIVGGKTENIGKEAKSGENTTVTVDQSKLSDNIKGAAEGSSVVVPVSANNAVTASLVVKNIEDMADKEMTLTVQTGNVAYNLNTAAIDTAALTAAFPGADMSQIPFNVAIKNSSASVEGETLVLSPVEFTVTATYGGKTVSVDTFSAYIDREIQVTAEQAARITTAVVVNADGSTRHVPTKVIEKSGKYYAVINSRTNSTYALIQNEVDFADAAGKWYAAAVNEMGSRKIIAGRSASAFDGDASITRAEFAAILVRALGLPTDGTSTFTDVSASAWYSGSVASAAQYGIVSGRGENQFAPGANITRQEAMAMLQRAAALTEFTGASGSLNDFTDANRVGSWAQDATAWNVGSGLIQGADSKLNPTANITRAETAAVILRLLQKAELVEVRSKI